MSEPKGTQDPPEPSANHLTSWRWPWHRRSAAARRQAKVDRNLDHQFNGRWAWNGLKTYYRPRRALDKEHQDHVALGDDDYGGSLQKDGEGRFVYRNQFGQESAKYSDVAVYLSPTNFAPKRLLVQSTGAVLRDDLGTGDWRRTKISGDVPTVLKISEWAFEPFRHKTWYRRIDGCVRVLLVSLPVQLMISLQSESSWDDGDTVDIWPKHAINPLDERPHGPSAETKAEKGKMVVPSSRKRLLRPRQLVVQQPDGSWMVENPAPANKLYVFISFADKAFSSDSGRHLIQKMAQRAALDAGCHAYWLDFLCRAPEPGDLLDSDVYRMCDVIRGSQRVTVMLPDDRDESRTLWGSRMWTLPEAMLAPGHECHFCHQEGDDLVTETLNLLQMSADVWQHDDADLDEEDGGPTRLLAEHYAGVLTLSRLELFPLALRALQRRSLDNYKFFTRSDVAYALMGLLHYRIERDDTDASFQSLAQLSLRNDSDRIVERMISLYPKPDQLAQNPFFSVSAPDQYHTHLWDIDANCHVVGVAQEDNTVLLDSCRAMHIRWKNFPRPVVVRDNGYARLLATAIVAVTTWWLLQGVSLAITYAPFYASSVEGLSHYGLEWLMAGFLFVAILLSCFGPGAVRRLYGGQVLQSTSNLVGIEGVMPIHKLEKIVFGQNNGRLSYEASSSPFAEHYRRQDRREGIEPPWVATEQPDLAPMSLPPGHRLFTLVDTGELSVTIFSAERPPTVALLCGREGGMLRAVLCSWQFENDCLYKEAVLRMPSNVWEAATPKGWLKLCLTTLNQGRIDERLEKARREREEKERREREAKKRREDEGKAKTMSGPNHLQ